MGTIHDPAGEICGLKEEGGSWGKSRLQAIPDWGNRYRELIYINVTMITAGTRIHSAKIRQLAFLGKLSGFKMWHYVDLTYLEDNDV